MNCSNCAGEKVASGVIMASKMGNVESGNHMIGVPFLACRKCGHLSVNLSRSALETVDVWQIPSQGKEANMAQNPERKRGQEILIRLSYIAASVVLATAWAVAWDASPRVCVLAGFLACWVGAAIGSGVVNNYRKVGH